MRLCTGRTAYRGSRGIALPSNDHRTRRGWGVSLTPLPLFTPPGKTWYPSYRRLGGARDRSGQARKTSSPPGFDPRTVQPVASRCTNYATRPTKISLGYSSIIQRPVMEIHVWWDVTPFGLANIHRLVMWSYFLHLQILCLTLNMKFLHPFETSVNICHRQGVPYQWPESSLAPQRESEISHDAQRLDLVKKHLLWILHHTLRMHPPWLYC